MKGKPRRRSSSLFCISQKSSLPGRKTRSKPPSVINQGCRRSCSLERRRISGFCTPSLWKNKIFLKRSRPWESVYKVTGQSRALPRFPSISCTKGTLSLTFSSEWFSPFLLFLDSYFFFSTLKKILLYLSRYLDDQWRCPKLMYANTLKMEEGGGRTAFKPVLQTDDSVLALRTLGLLLLDFC